MSARILFVEDDQVLRENYTEVLEEEGFTVHACEDRPTAIELFKSKRPDLVILDISLGRERDGGFQICQDIRSVNQETPIMFLTSHEKDADKISGMRMGADDYLLKDISLDYLVVRIDSMLKRFDKVKSLVSGDQELDLIERGDLHIDVATGRATWRGSVLELSLTQFKILLELVLKPGQVKSATKLMVAADIVVEVNTISAHVKSIRKQFKQLDEEFDCLRTEYGHGYRWLDLAVCE